MEKMVQIRQISKFKKIPKWCSVCDPAKIIFTSKFSYVLFCNATNKTETETAKLVGDY
jgi:hypothetical protein